MAFLFLFSGFAHSESVLLTQETSSKNISSLIEYRYRGQQFAGCSPEHIDGLEDLEWHQIPTEVLRVKRTPFGNWLRFSVKNSESTIQSRILLLGWLNVPDTQLCFFDKSGKFVSARSGYSNDIEDEKILTNLPHFRIDLEPNENRIFYLFVLSNEDINYRIQIMGLEEFELRKRLRSIISYSIIGIVAIAIFILFLVIIDLEILLSFLFYCILFLFLLHFIFFMDALLQKLREIQIIYFGTVISYFLEFLTCFYFYIYFR